MGGVLGYVDVSGGLLAIYKGVSGWRGENGRGCGLCGGKWGVVGYL